MLEAQINSKGFYRINDHDVVSLCYLAILQLVLLGFEARHNVPHWILRLANDRDDWDMYPWGSYVWPTLYYQLRNANVKRWQPLYATEQEEGDDDHNLGYFDGRIRKPARISLPINQHTKDDVPVDLYRRLEEQDRVLKELMQKDDAREQMYNKMNKFMEVNC
ncbi:hypothetical protein Tco_0888255 [Tanacetum coccineum]